MSLPAPLHSIRLRLTIAASAVAVIVVGYALRPRAELPPPPVEEAPQPILREVVIRREAISIYATLQQTARNVAHLAARVRLVEGPRDRWSDLRPDPLARTRFGVVVEPAALLAAAADYPRGALVEAELGDGRIVRGLVTARYADSGLALIGIEGSVALPVPVAAPEPPAAGELVVAVAPGEEGLMTVPVAVAEVRSSGLVLAGTLDRYAGVPVFDDEGRWLGVVTPSADGARVVLPTALVEEVAPDEPTQRLGLSLRLGDDTSTPRQVIVDEVAPDGRAAAAGLQVGDVILAIDGGAPSDLEAVVAALGGGGGEAVTVQVRRGRRTLTLRIAAAAERP